MQVQILEQSSHSVRAQCNKTVASIGVLRGTIYIVCENASHRAWKGLGKTFKSFAAASDNYKSAEMKALIAEAAAVFGELE